MTRVIFLDLDETLIAQEKAFALAYQSVATLATKVVDVDRDSLAEFIPVVAASCFDKLAVAGLVRRCRFGGRDVLWGDPSGDSEVLRQLTAVAPAYRKDVWSTLLAKHSITDPALAESLDACFRHEMTTKMTAFDEVEQVLTNLRQNYRLAIITNGMPAAQQAKLQRLGLNNHFETLIASADIGVGKPAGEIFRHALAVMRVGAHEAIMVGDSWDGDVIGARREGMNACWVRRDDADPMANTEGTPIISDLSSLIALLQSPPAREPSRIIAS